MNITTIRKAGLADLIAAAFYALGHRPRESVVLVGLHPPRLTIGLVVRCDLPSVRDVGVALTPALQHLIAVGDDGVVVLVVSDARPRGPSGGGRSRGGRSRSASAERLPHRELADRVARLARGAGLRVVDVLAVGDERWRSFRCTDPSCCPPGGRPMAEVFSSRVALARVLKGDVLADGEAGLLADVEPRPSPGPGPVPTSEASGPGEDGSPADGSGGAGAASGGEGAGSTVSGADGGVRDLAPLARWRQLLEAPEEEAADVGWLAEALTDSWLRDALLVTLVPGTGTLAEDLAAGREAPAALDHVFEAAPDPDLLARGRRVLAAVARTSPPGRRADALALLAWAAWWSGEGTRGRLLAGRALADQPGHRLATLVDRMLALGIAPDWARRGRRGERDAGRAGEGAAARAEDRGEDWSDRVDGSGEPSGS